MDPDVVKNYYNDPKVVKHYAEATVQVGLWKSEEKVFRRVFQNEDSILECGCGTGRISMGLWEIGYRNLLATDFAREQILEARRMARILNYRIHWKVEDATQLSFEDGLFEGVIFGFNGLMQIPGRENRKKAMVEIHRVLKPGGWFVFTSHDRELTKYKKFWEKERGLWRKGKQNPELDDYGDRFESTDLGDLFIHVPTPGELREDLKSAGFRIEADVLRSKLANEDEQTRIFSDECRFWVVQRPPETPSEADKT